MKKLFFQKVKTSIFNAINAQTFIKTLHFRCLKSVSGALVNISLFLYKNGVGFSSKREVEEIAEGIDPIQPCISTTCYTSPFNNKNITNFHM